MSADVYAIIALIVYAVVIVAVVAWRYRQTGMTPQAWILYVGERLYVGMFYHWRANRRCPFPATGPAIIIANHRGPVDPLFVWMNNHLGRRNRPVRIIGFMTASEYCSLPGLAWLFKAMESIPVERHGKDMRPARQALERLKHGHLLGVFPEGRINTGDGLLEGDTGIAWLALHSRVPVYPVFVNGSPGGRTMVEPFYTPSSVRVLYGDPIDLSAFYDRRRNHALLTEVTDHLMRRLADLGGVAYAKDASASAPCRDEAGNEDAEQRQTLPMRAS